MYVAVVVLLTVVLPLAFAAVDRFVLHAPSGFLVLLAFWMAFWAGGVRLLTAGLRQTLRPELTTEQIFGIKGKEVLPVMREVGFANLAMGTLGVLSVLDRNLLVPAALVSGLYYGFAGIGHLLHGDLNLKRRVAMLTDLWVFAVLAIYLVSVIRF